MTIRWNDIDPQKRAAIDAVTAFAGASLVGLTIGSQSGVPSDVASGTLLRAGRRFVVLTALHVAREFLNGTNGMFWRGIPDAVRDVDEVAYAADGGLDVALILLRPQHGARFAALDPPTADVVAPIDDVDVADGEAAVLAGYPSDLHRHHPSTSEVRFSPLFLFPSVRPGCRADGHVPRGLHLDMGVDATRWKDKQAVTMPPPHGLSGCAVWRIENRPIGNAAVWSPTRQARVIGVQSTFFESLRCLRAESAADWGDWFREKMAEIATL
jgi:hypothetical protein